MHIYIYICIYMAGGLQGTSEPRLSLRPPGQEGLVAPWLLLAPGNFRQERLRLPGVCGHFRGAEATAVLPADTRKKRPVSPSTAGARPRELRLCQSWKSLLRKRRLWTPGLAEIWELSCEAQTNAERLK